MEQLRVESLGKGLALSGPKFHETDVLELWQDAG